MVNSVKKTILPLFLLVLGFNSLDAEPRYRFDRPFAWTSPEIMAQGGSYTAIASGFNSLMTNPAGFAFNHNRKKMKSRSHTNQIYTTIQGDTIVVLEEEATERTVYQERGEVTILGLQPIITANPFTLLGDPSAFSNTQSMIPVLFDQLKNNGLGAAVQAGGGYVGHGLGFGLIAYLDGMFPGTRYITSVNGSMTLTVSLVGGYAHKFHFGPVDLAIGADVRPMWRLKIKDLGFNTVLDQLGGEGFSPEDLLANSDTLTGWAIGFDAGVLAKWRFLSMGFSLRDIAHTRYQYKTTNLITGSLNPFTGKNYSGIPYISPMTLNIGIGVQPDFGRLNKFLAFKAHAEFKIPLINADEVADFVEKSFWSILHLGTEVKFFDILSLRGGFSSGYLTAGFGLDLWIVELNAAIYSQEVGRQAGDDQQMGVNMELVFRF